LEKRLLQKEESLDRKYEILEKKEETLTKKESEIEKVKNELQEIHQRHRCELERISGLSTDEAKMLLLKDVEEEIQQEVAIKIRDLEARAKEESDRKAREIISLAIQRCAADHVA
jgi:ribonuclease Y